MGMVMGMGMGTGTGMGTVWEAPRKDTNESCLIFSEALTKINLSIVINGNIGLILKTLKVGPVPMVRHYSRQ